MSSTTIAAVIVATLLVFLACGVAIALWWRRRHRQATGSITFAADTPTPTATPPLQHASAPGVGTPPLPVGLTTAGEPNGTPQPAAPSVTPCGITRGVHHGGESPVRTPLQAQGYGAAPFTGGYPVTPDPCVAASAAGDVTELDATGTEASPDQATAAPHGSPTLGYGGMACLGESPPPCPPPAVWTRQGQANPLAPVHHPHHLESPATEQQRQGGVQLPKQLPPASPPQGGGGGAAGVAGMQYPANPLAGGGGGVASSTPPPPAHRLPEVQQQLQISADASLEVEAMQSVILANVLKGRRGDGGGGGGGATTPLPAASPAGFAGGSAGKVGVITIRDDDSEFDPLREGRSAAAAGEGVLAATAGSPPPPRPAFGMAERLTFDFDALAPQGGGLQQQQQQQPLCLSRHNTMPPNFRDLGERGAVWGAGAAGPPAPPPPPPPAAGGGVAGGAGRPAAAPPSRQPLPTFNISVGRGGSVNLHRAGGAGGSAGGVGGVSGITGERGKPAPTPTPAPLRDLEGCVVGAAGVAPPGVPAAAAVTPRGAGGATPATPVGGGAAAAQRPPQRPPLGGGDAAGVVAAAAAHPSFRGQGLLGSPAHAASGSVLGGSGVLRGGGGAVGAPLPSFRQPLQQQQQPGNGSIFSGASGARFAGSIGNNLGMGRASELGFARDAAAQQQLGAPGVLPSPTATQQLKPHHPRPSQAKQTPRDGVPGFGGRGVERGGGSSRPIPGDSGVIENMHVVPPPVVTPEGSIVRTPGGGMGQLLRKNPFYFSALVADWEDRTGQGLGPAPPPVPRHPIADVTHAEVPEDEWRLLDEANRMREGHDALYWAAFLVEVDRLKTAAPPIPPGFR